MNINKLFFTLFSVSLLCLLSCQNQTHSTLKIAASSTPHAELLEQIKPTLNLEGIQLEIIVIDDYQIPNRALNDREVDANFFQHLPFLELQNKELSCELISFAKVHLEPMGLYSKKVKQLTEIPNNGAVVIPSDPTNQSRALILLEKTGLISLKNRSLTITKLDIDENPKKLQIFEIDAAVLPRSLEDAHLAAIPANFALQASLSPITDALILEDQQSLFTNILAIRPEDQERKDLKQLKIALTSPEIRNHIEQTYRGAIIPAFENN